MKMIRQIGSLFFVAGLFITIFAGVPWHVIVSDDPVVPLWLRIAIFCLLGGILVVLLTLALEQTKYKKSEKRQAHVLSLPHLTRLNSHLMGMSMINFKSLDLELFRINRIILNLNIEMDTTKLAVA